MLAAGIGFGAAEYHYSGRIDALKEALEIRQASPPPVGPNGPFVRGWRSMGPSFEMDVDTSTIKDRAENYNLILINSVPYSNVDRMTDPHIDVSVPYSIDGGMLTMAVISKNVRFPIGISVNALLLVVQLPKSVDVSKIRTLRYIGANATRI